MLAPTGIINASSTLVDADCQSLTLQQVSQLPLILPTGRHGLRRRVCAEFERRGLAPNVVAEIDSAGLLMDCVCDGMGATIKPVPASTPSASHRTGWRALSINDVRITRRNYLYAAATDAPSPSQRVVARELCEVAAALADSGDWPGVTRLS